MKIEKEIFKNLIFNAKKATLFGFKKNKDSFEYSENFLDDKFIAIISVKEDSSEVVGKVIEREFMEEYTLFRVEQVVGEFPLKVRQEYVKILQKIKENCFETKNFISNQANVISDLIYKEYNVKPEFLWQKYPNFGIFRNKTSKKWFALIMNLQGEKLDKALFGEIDVLNVKLDHGVNEAVKVNGVYPCYHMNKKYWVTIVLNGTLPNDEIMQFIEASFNNCK